MNHVATPHDVVSRERSMSRRPAAREETRPRVLVVEDDPSLAVMLRYNLEKLGYLVEEASDGQEALLRVAEQAPDLVLLDWMLPSLSGIEVCRQIRRRPQTRDLPIIMLTARIDEQDSIRGLNTGADDYITKPFSMEALVARVRALLRRASAGVAEIMRIEGAEFARLLHGPEAREALAASAAKRAPDWSRLASAAE